MLKITSKGLDLSGSEFSAEEIAHIMMGFEKDTFYNQFLEKLNKLPKNVLENISSIFDKLSVEGDMELDEDPSYLELQAAFTPIISPFVKEDDDQSIG